MWSWPWPCICARKGVAGSGEETLRKAEQLAVDLILINIRMKGDTDRIETGAKVLETLDLPVIYLAAESVRRVLDRAKLIGPCGYVRKPLQQSHLRVSIEIAIHKHRLERDVRQQGALFATVLQGIGDAVIVMNTRRRIVFLNSAAERLTGWEASEAKNQHLLTVLRVFDQNLESLREELFTALMPEDEPVSLPFGLTAMHRNGNAYVIEGDIALNTDCDQVVGAVMTFRDGTARRKEEQLIRQENKMQAVGHLATGVAEDFNKILIAIRSEAESELGKELLQATSRTAWEAALRTIDLGEALVRKLVVFGHIWSA
jgi:two-component system, cell cycle sensor histidine kinase and response regulator CckA